ncbi:uncharacterized protein G2W53_026690 [Senna tora]|uniref:Uncharacterized protein n=1 Tax=Senna tora TaxID=362788 RepID=A0A834TG47_9FABA|nr:uncharacterized protein G2W53_026690 [Senna tora]
MRQRFEPWLETKLSNSFPLETFRNTIKNNALFKTLESTTIAAASDFPKRTSSLEGPIGFLSFDEPWSSVFELPHGCNHFVYSSLDIEASLLCFCDIDRASLAQVCFVNFYFVYILQLNFLLLLLNLFIILMYWRNQFGPS